MSKIPGAVQQDPRPPKLVMVNPRQHTKHGLCMPNGEFMKGPMRLPAGTYLWTGDNRLALVARDGLKVFTHQQTHKEILRRMAAKAEAAAALKRQQVERGATARLFSKLQRDELWRRMTLAVPVLGLVAFLVALVFALGGCSGSSEGGLVQAMEAQRQAKLDLPYRLDAKEVSPTITCYIAYSLSRNGGEALAMQCLEVHK